MAESFHFDGLARLQNNNNHKIRKENARVVRGPRPLDETNGELCVFKSNHKNTKVNTLVILGNTQKVTRE